MAGVELPDPGRATFHFTFLSFVKSDGNFPLLDTPLPVGPLHAGQLAPLKCDKEDKTNIIKTEKLFIVIQIINNQQI